MPHTPNNSVPPTSGDGGDPDMLVVLTTARTEFEAQTLAEALRARGNRAEVFATAASSLQWEAAFTDPIKVMVRRADVGEAEKVRASLKADSVDIDWDEVDTGAGAEQDDAPPRKSAQVTVFVVGLFFGIILITACVGLIAHAVVNAIFRVGMEFDGNTPVPMYAGWAVAAVVFVVLWRGSRNVREEAKGSRNAG